MLFHQMAETERDRWTEVWQDVAALSACAGRLRHLSQQEPLAQPRPGYPRAGLGRSHADDVREVLDAIGRGLERIRAALPAVLPPGGLPPGIAADEHPNEIAKRVDALSRLTSALAREAFQPAPALPPHSPPYLVEPPGHDLAGTKAVLLAIGIEELTSSVRNLLLAAANTQAG
jgi:hypothetical protein